MEGASGAIRSRPLTGDERTGGHERAACQDYNCRHPTLSVLSGIGSAVAGADRQ